MFHIVDDDKPILEFLSELIREMGFGVMAFSSPLKYLSYVDSSEYRAPIALISDVSMPEMDGFQMIERVRSKCLGIRVAIISGYFDNRMKAKENACTFLQKPFDFNSITQLVEAFTRCHDNGKSDCPHASRCKRC